MSPHTPGPSLPPISNPARAQTTSGVAATADGLLLETELSIQQVQADVTAGKGDVVDTLVRFATTVAPV